MFIVILITARNIQEANAIANVLVSRKLAACVNIVKNIQSVFFWDGKIDNSQEVLMIVKTKKALFAKVVKEVETMHSYDCPEIIALPIVSGNKKYLKWLKDSTLKIK